MTQSLPEKPDLLLLKKQAKKLLKQYRDGHPAALASVNNHYPKPEAFANLRDAQLVIARGYGYAAWSQLRDAIDLAQYADQSLSDKATLFIQLGCLQYNGGDSLRNYERARKLLAAFPDIAQFSFYTALVANDAKAVAEYLASDATLATSAGGPLGWEPLLYVTYTRIGEPEGSQDSLLIAQQLLDNGASPDSHVILNDTYRFTALTGAMGEGEQAVNQPAHQNADELVALLLSAGANPNDAQGLYNTMFSDSVDKWLAVLLSNGLQATDLLNWNATGTDALVTTLDFQLASAVSANCQSRVSVLLNAGASPNARNTYNGRAVHTNALLAGYTSIASLLESEGANPEVLAVEDQFALACVREDDHGIVALLNNHPALIQDAKLLHAAAEHSSMRIVKLLIEQGFDVNGQSDHGRTLLHQLALSNDAAKIKQLLGLGARTDIRDTSHNHIAAGFAAYSASYEAMHLLLDSCDSLMQVVCCAYLERAMVLVEQKPASIHQQTEQGHTVLHIVGCWLHDEPEYDEHRTLLQWLVSAGADLNVKNNQDQTPLEFHLAHGSETVAELLAEMSV